VAARKLKVFRTAIGFHDAYIAAPSQKAALKAWGSDRNLFATGAAEQVTTGKPAAAALADPGKLIKIARGTTDQHLAALPKKKAALKSAKPAAAARPARPNAPRPSRAELDRAEKAIGTAETVKESDLTALDRQIDDLTTRRRAVRQDHDRKIDRLRTKQEAARDRYERKLAEWNDGS
jgi:hypothetical protein